MYKKYLLTSILCSFSLLTCMEDQKPTLHLVTSPEVARLLLLKGTTIEIRHSNNDAEVFEQAFVNQDHQTLAIILRKSYAAPTADAIAQALITIRNARSLYEKTPAHHHS